MAESSSRHYAYSRKQKSIGLLCSNFLSMDNMDATEFIGLDEAAVKLEDGSLPSSIFRKCWVFTRKTKNKYTWKGFGEIPKAVQDLKIHTVDTKKTDV
ncbi:hypothetical protein GQ457_05G029120 [Hibiscus cannabinus]